MKEIPDLYFSNQIRIDKYTWNIKRHCALETRITVNILI